MGSLKESEWQTAGRVTKKAEPPSARVVGWNGDWMCKCGNRRSVLAGCRTCGLTAPCRDYLRGACPSIKLCRYPHPPFALPSGAPPAGAGKGELCVAPEAPGYALRTQQTAQQGQRTLRTISWMGDWACPCGEDNWFRDATCKRCKKSGPCREWVRGRCKKADGRCRFPHTPFDLPPNQPERLLNSKEGAVVRPPAGAVMLTGAAEPEPPAKTAPAAVAAATGAPASTAAPGGKQPDVAANSQQGARPRTVLLVKKPEGGHAIVADAQGAEGTGATAAEAAPTSAPAPSAWQGAPASSAWQAAPAPAPSAWQGGAAAAPAPAAAAALPPQLTVSPLTENGSAATGCAALFGLPSALACVSLDDSSAGVAGTSPAAQPAWGGLAAAVAAAQQPTGGDPAHGPPQRAGSSGGLFAAGAVQGSLPAALYASYTGSSLFSYGGISTDSSSSSQAALPSARAGGAAAATTGVTATSGDLTGGGGFHGC